MLPSKGYFKSLDCPCFEIGFCDRPYCLFRHNPRYIQCNTLDNVINTERLLFDYGSEVHFFNEHTTSIQNAEYKPTPISELNKLPVRNNSFDDETYFEGINFSDPQFEENTTTFDCTEKTNAHENLTFNNVLNNDFKVEECEQYSSDRPITLCSLINESNCLKSQENISNEGPTNCEYNDNENSYTETVAAIKSHENQKKEKSTNKFNTILNLSKRDLKIKPRGESNSPSNSTRSKGEKQKKKKSTKSKILSLSKSGLKRKPKCNCNSTVSKANSTSHTDDKYLEKRDTIITREEESKNTDKIEGSNIEVSGKQCKKYKKYASKSKSSLKPKMYSNGENEALNSEYIIVISSEDESNSFSNKQMDKILSGKELEKDLSDKTYNLLANDATASFVSTDSLVPNSRNGNIKIVSSVYTESKGYFHLEGDASTLDNRVEGKKKTRISMGTAVRDQKIGKRIKMMTPARRLLMFASQRDREKTENITLKENSSTVKIRSVPNVKLLLQEKEKLFKMLASKNSKANKSLKN